MTRMSGDGVSTLAPCGYIMLLTGMNSEGPVREGPPAAGRRRMNHLFVQADEGHLGHTDSPLN